MTTNPFVEVKTCVACKHLQQNIRAMTDRPEYICGLTNNSAHDERNTGACGRNAGNWEKK